MSETGPAGGKPPGEGGRLARVDIARGIALLAMALYHFSWDLAFVGLVSWPVATGPAWRAAAMAIASAFLTLVGLGLVLATRRGLVWRRFLARFLRIAAAAALVTLGTWWLFPATYVYFGILHHIALASVLALPFLALPVPLVLAAAVAAVFLPEAGLDLAEPFLMWTGLAAWVRPANDFVPLFPWFGAVLLGIAIGKLLPLQSLAATPGRVGRAFAFAGRHSLAVYLIHQPLLFGVASGIAAVVPVEVRFESSCVASCASSGTEGAVCERFCACVVTELAPTGYFDDGAPNDDARLGVAAAACPVEPLN
jgi:uncharacterized membrane protein